MSHPLFFANGETASSHICRAVQSAAIAASLLTAACGSGGDGRIVPQTSITGNSPGAGNGSGTGSSANSGSGSDSGTGTRAITGTVAINNSSVVAINTDVLGDSVGTPARASFSQAPVAQIATSGGPTFDGSSGSFSSNISFPALTSSLQFQSV